MAQGDRERAPRVLGLTGPIGCGKTTVGDMLLELGALDRIDADVEVHALMQPGTEVTREISSEFGQDVLAPDGGVDRSRLGRIVFSQPDKLRALEGITHPAVRRSIRRRLETYRGYRGIVVVDAVKLLQSDLLPLTHAVWVVRCDAEEQLRRLRAMRGMTDDDALNRVRAQPSFGHQRVTTVIDNSGSREDLRRLVDAAWERLRSASEPS